MRAAQARRQRRGAGGGHDAVQGCAPLRSPRLPHHPPGSRSRCAPRRPATGSHARWRVAGEVRDLLGGQVTISGLYEQVGRDELNVVVRTRHGASHLDIIPSRLSPPARVAVQIVTVADPPPDAADNEHVLPQPFAVRDTSRSPFKPPVRFSTFASCWRNRTQSSRARSCCSATMRTPTPWRLR